MVRPTLRTFLPFGMLAGVALILCLAMFVLFAVVDNAPWLSAFYNRYVLWVAAEPPCRRLLLVVGISVSCPLAECTHVPRPLAARQERKAVLGRHLPVLGDCFPARRHLDWRRTRYWWPRSRSVPCR